MSILASYVVPHPPLIIPAVGRGKEAEISATIAAYRAVAREIAALCPETILLSTPHLTMYQDYFHIASGASARGDMAGFGEPQCSLETEYDQEFIMSLSKELEAAGFPGGTHGSKGRELDHASFVPLWFIQKEYAAFKTVRIGLSGLSLSQHYRLGMYIKEVAGKLGRSCVYIASGDLSHRLLEDGPYGFAPEGPLYDQRIMEILGAARFKDILTMDPDLTEAAGECGHRSFAIMAGAMDRMNAAPRILSYEGPFGVGYGVVSFKASGPDESRNFLDQYEGETREATALRRLNASAPVRLALSVIEAHLEKTPFRLETYLQREMVPEFMTAEKAGVFVSLKKEGQLRGCIGTIAPTSESIAREIQRNAVEAAFHDPRFAPLERNEFDKLSVSVDVLSTPEPIAGPSELDPLNYGVIVTKGKRRGLLLPNLAGVDTAEQQINIAKSKAGIDSDDGIFLERFKVVRYE